MTWAIWLMVLARAKKGRWIDVSTVSATVAVVMLTDAVRRAPRTAATARAAATVGNTAAVPTTRAPPRARVTRAARRGGRSSQPLNTVPTARDGSVRAA